METKNQSTPAADANNPPPSRPRRSLPMRCKGCFYILDHLQADRCPECGREFDPADESTFTRRPPFVWWTFWMPSLLLAVIAGVGLFAVLVPRFGYTWSTTFAIAFAVGGIAGYGAKTKAPGAAILGVVAMWGAIAILTGGGLLGGFCGFVIAGLALLPALMGAVIGFILKESLRSSRFSQRDYFSLLIQLLIVLLPIGLATLEGRHDMLPIASVQTRTTMNVPPATAWHSIQFFEQVRRPIPWLLWLSPELRPVSTSGHSEHVGDVRVCTYERGHLVKLITEVIPDRRLAFRVVRQDRIETRGVVLLDGSFDLEPIDGGRKTVVTLTTRYQPLLSPRWAYAWSEDWAVHTLHGHVLAGMNDLATKLSPSTAGPASADSRAAMTARRPTAPG